MQYHRIVRLGHAPREMFGISGSGFLQQQTLKPDFSSPQVWPRSCKLGCLIGLLSASANPIKTHDLPSFVPSEELLQRDLAFKLVPLNGVNE